MRLEVGSFPVHRVEMCPRSGYASGALAIDGEAVRALVLRDPRIADVRLEPLHPGESVRVVRALDAVEPMAKVRGEGTTFPGFNGPPVTAGRGVTHRLEGL